MDSRDALFQSSRQPQKKLEIALSRFLGDGEDPFGQYSAYLKKRLRPAIHQIIQNGSVVMLGRMLHHFSLTDAQMEEAVRLAAKLGRPEMTAVLMLRDIPAPFPCASDSCETLLKSELVSLYLEQPFFGNALACLTFVPTEKQMIGTDGACIFYNKELLLRTYRAGGLRILLLHIVLHCLFLHIFVPRTRMRREWDEACDRFVFHQLSQIGYGASACKSTAAMPEPAASGVRAEDIRDSHELWYASPALQVSDQSGGDSSNTVKKTEAIKRHWMELRRQMPASLSARFCTSNRGVSGGSRLEWAILKEKGRYDFRSYLNRFCTISEEMQTDPDSIDPIPYYYGQKYCDGMPLIEPLETSETAKIHEFVIAVDTSGSCTLPIVQRFLEETCSILTDREYFFRRMRVHLIQCDCVIQDHQIITDREAFKRSSQEFRICGRGGTDFTPVFTYIETLRQKKQIGDLKGLLYFTDGDGIYPQKRPDYETAFVFPDRRCLDFKRPDYVIPLCLDT